MADYTPWGTAENAVVVNAALWEHHTVTAVAHLYQHVHLYTALHLPVECVLNRFGGLCK